MENRRSIDSLDVAKFVAALFVVAIHTELFKGSLLQCVVFPWARMAVPLFFMISSFLFFRRQVAVGGGGASHFAKRLMGFYSFWLVALLPLVVLSRHDRWVTGNMIGSAINILVDVFYRGAVPGSWFVIALMISVIGVDFLARRVGNVMVLCFSLLLFFFCCAHSAYWPYFKKIQWFATASNFYTSMFISPVFTWPAAMLWVALGKFFAEKRNVLPCGRGVKFWLLVVGCALLWSEWLFVKRNFGMSTCDTYVTLPVVCTTVFSLILNSDFQWDGARRLRSMSAVVYITHPLISQCIHYVFECRLGCPSLLRIPLFCVTLSCSLLLANCIWRLSSRWSLLRLAY